MARALLDINVVIALLDQGHVLHHPAVRWLERELEHGWASCPITQNGVVRIMALAVCHGGRFVTFDQRIGVEVVPGARAADLCVIESP